MAGVRATSGGSARRTGKPPRIGTAWTIEPICGQPLKVRAAPAEGAQPVTGASAAVATRTTGAATGAIVVSVLVARWTAPATGTGTWTATGSDGTADRCGATTAPV